MDYRTMRRAAADLLTSNVSRETGRDRSAGRWTLVLTGLAAASAAAYLAYRTYDRRLGQLVDHHLVDGRRNGAARAASRRVPADRARAAVVG